MTWYEPRYKHWRVKTTQLARSSNIVTEVCHGGAFLVTDPGDKTVWVYVVPAYSGALKIVIALWILTWRQSVVAEHINAEVLVIQNCHRSSDVVVRHRELAQRHCHRHGEIGREVDWSEIGLKRLWRMMGGWGAVILVIICVVLRINVYIRPKVFIWAIFLCWVHTRIVCV